MKVQPIVLERVVDEIDNDWWKVSPSFSRFLKMYPSPAWRLWARLRSILVKVLFKNHKIYSFIYFAINLVKMSGDCRRRGIIWSSWSWSLKLSDLRRVLDRSKCTSRLLTRGLARAGVMGCSCPIRWKETMIFGSSTWSFMMIILDDDDDVDDDYDDDDDDDDDDDGGEW